MELAYRLAVDEAPYIKHIRSQRDHADHAGRRSRRPRPHGRSLQLAPGASGRELSAAAVLGPLRRARQQPRRDGHDAEAHAQRARHLSRLARAGAARPARIGAVPLRQHRRRRAVQRVDRSDPRRRMAAARLGQRAADDQARHARRVHARRLRYLEPGLPDVHRRHAQRHQPPVRNLRQRRRRHGQAHPRARTNTRAPGTARTRRCRR